MGNRCTCYIPFILQFASLHAKASFSTHIGFHLNFFNKLSLKLYRFYMFGIYVVMFTEILKTLFKVLFLFSILIFGFGLVFYILNGNVSLYLLFNLNSKSSLKKSLFYKESRGNIPRDSPWISIIRVIVMMLGETDGIGSFINPYTEGVLHFGPMSIFFLILFILLVPILLTNLLVIL